MHKLEQRIPFEVAKKHVDDLFSATELACMYHVSAQYIRTLFVGYGLRFNRMTDKKQTIALMGRRFGKLLVLKRTKTDSPCLYYECICDCGTVKAIKSYHLLNGSVTHCGCSREPKLKPLLVEAYRKRALVHVGEKLGRLTITGIEHATNKDGTGKWSMVCLCDCGGTVSVEYYKLKSGWTSSCGCILKEIMSKKGAPPLSMYGNKRKWYFIQDGREVRCRSGFEVLYANYLSENNIPFLYEPTTFKITPTSRYTPDFYRIKDNTYVEIKGAFLIGKNGMGQKEKIAIFRKTHKLELLFWDDIVSVCELNHRCYKTYFCHAKKANISIEHYLAKKLYIC